MQPGRTTCRCSLTWQLVKEVELVHGPPVGAYRLGKRHLEVLVGLGRKAHDFGAAGAGAAGDCCPAGAVTGDLYLVTPGVVPGRVGNFHVQFGERLSRAHVSTE